MEQITIINNQDAQATQSVQIVPDPIQPPTRTIPLEQYVQQLTYQQTNLQAQLDEVTAKLQAVTDQGVDVSAVQEKIQNRVVAKVATPIQKVIQ